MTWCRPSSWRCLVRSPAQHRQTSTQSVAKSRGETMIEERAITVAMRDATRLAVDVYRPEAPGKYPVLYASALHNKDIQGPDIADILPPQPAHAPLWFGPIEAGGAPRVIRTG